MSAAREPGDGGHVDLDALAEFAEGLQDSRAESIRAHVAACPQCQRRAADLTEVRRVLAAAAPPTTVPDEVVARIDAAISTAAEADERRRSHVRRAWYQRRPIQVGVAAAAAVVVAAGGFATTRALLVGDRAVTSAGGSGSGDASQSAEGTRGQPPAAAPLSKSGTSGPQVVATKTTYSTGSLDRKVAELVRRRMAQGSADEPSPDVAQVPEALRPLARPGRLGRCVAAATGDPDRRPLVVDLAQYEGRPAAVIVLPGRAQGRLDVWVVGRACSTDNPDVLLHTQAG